MYTNTKEDLVITDLMWCKVIYSIILFVLGFIGNTLCIFTILALKQYKKSVLYMYVLQLATANILFLLTIPFKVDEILHFGWSFPAWTCIYCNAILYLTYNASILFLMVMGIDRYIEVCHESSAQLQGVRRPTFVCIVIAVVWITAFLYTFPFIRYTHYRGIEPHCKCTERVAKSEDSEEQPTLLGSVYEVIDENEDGDSVMDHETDPSSGADTSITSTYTQYMGNVNDNDRPKEDISSRCINNDTYQKNWTRFIYVNFIVLYIVPIVLLTVCYGLIIMKVRQLSKATTSAMELRTIDPASTKVSNEMEDSKKLSQVRIRVIKMSGAFVLTFIACWLPFHLFHLMKLHGFQFGFDQEYICTLVQDIGILQAYNYPVIIALLYIIFGTDLIKRGLKKRFSVYRRVNKLLNIETSMKRAPPPPQDEREQAIYYTIDDTDTTHKTRTSVMVFEEPQIAP